jgi:hypothetical protein
MHATVNSAIERTGEPFPGLRFAHDVNVKGAANASARPPSAS